MTLQVTAAEWAAIEAAGSGVLFRASEWCSCDSERSTDAHGGHTHPPAEFVEAAQPCETCGGWGKNIGTRYAPHPPTGDCPDCLDGKRRVAVVVPCGACAEPMIETDTEGHLDGCDTGFVTVGHVVVTWGPLVVVDRIGNVTTNDAVVVGANSVWHVKQLGDDLDERRLTLPPDTDPQSLVGQYALGVEVAV